MVAARAWLLFDSASGVICCIGGLIGHSDTMLKLGIFLFTLMAVTLVAACFGPQTRPHDQLRVREARDEEAFSFERAT